MNPFSVLLILLICVPVIEIYLLIQVGGFIGAVPTIVLIIFTAVLGAYLLKDQGLSTMQRVQENLAKGEIPAIEMVEGAILLFSGALLLTPGFVTDVVGFLSLTPVLRRAFAVHVMKSRFVHQPDIQGDFQRDESSQSGRRIIEGEFKREEDENNRSE